ncbi:hypothetical protein T05_8022 [Trichinella murrelli]|uniref:Uncharacterized protein n=1 Tax=Trichinella murrelli TaxID=144512 RepID=A0A0V0T2E4_9BILA|nr:hypothetical protein T05_8022 [Trichinella murrelli]
MIRKIADGSCCKQLTLFKTGKLLLLNKYSLKKGVIITALRGPFSCIAPQTYNKPFKYDRSGDSVLSKNNLSD